MKHHVLLDKEHMPLTGVKSTSKPAIVCTEMCRMHDGELIKYFCSAHDQLGCSECLRQNHRTCRPVLYIPEVAGSAEHAREYDDLKKHYNELSKSMEQMKKDAEDRIERAKKCEDDAVTAIDNFQEKVTLHFARLADAMKMQVKARKDQRDAQLQMVLSSVLGMLHGIEHVSSDLVTKCDAERKGDLFVAVKKGKERLLTMTREMARWQQTDQYVDFVFQPNEELLSLKIDVGSLLDVIEPQRDGHEAFSAGKDTSMGFEAKGPVTATPMKNRRYEAWTSGVFSEPQGAARKKSDMTLQGAARKKTDDQTLQGAAEKNRDDLTLQEAARSDDMTLQEATRRADMMLQEAARSDDMAFVQRVARRADMMLQEAAKKKSDDKTLQGAAKKKSNDKTLQGAAKKKSDDKTLQGAAKKKSDDMTFQMAARKNRDDQTLQGEARKKRDDVTLDLQEAAMKKSQEAARKIYIDDLKLQCAAKKKSQEAARKKIDDLTLPWTARKKRDDVNGDCVICLEKFTDPKRLKCGHVFCRKCVDEIYKYKQQCPVCAVCGQTPLTGTQPDGTMTVETDRWYSCAGYEDYGRIQITYRFPDGIQGPEHPSPGVRYVGISRTAYLPDNKQGTKIAKLLRVAFDRRLVFTIGKSATTGQSGVITWNGIHHKTNPVPNSQYGYPDPDYLNRVTEELAAKGVTRRDIQ